MSGLPYSLFLMRRILYSKEKPSVYLIMTQKLSPVSLGSSVNVEENVLVYLIWTTLEASIANPISIQWYLNFHRYSLCNSWICLNRMVNIFSGRSWYLRLPSFSIVLQRVLIPFWVWHSLRKSQDHNMEGQIAVSASLLFPMDKCSWKCS